MSTWTTEDRIEAEKMTAYQLADIMVTHDGSQVWEHGLEIANMLRKQADELDNVIPKLVKANGIIENLRIRIADLEAQIYGGTTK